VIQLALSLLLLALIAVQVPWTRAAVIAWLASIPLLCLAALMTQPGILRVLVVVVDLGWILVLLFPLRSPIGPLSRAERACHAVVHDVSAAARTAYLEHTLAEDRTALIAKLEALQPPDELWLTVKSAQLLDLRADPPQVGVGDATSRLVTWPWRVALDRRIVPVRLRLDDAIRALRLRRDPLPTFDALTRAMRYDLFFLRLITARLEDLGAREGGLLRWREEAAAILSLCREVRPPNKSWTKLRDLVIEIEGMELEAVQTALSAAQEERLAIARDAARQAWVALREQEPRGLAAAR
jgi:hypothetical protein